MARAGLPATSTANRQTAASLFIQAAPPARRQPIGSANELTTEEMAPAAAQLVTKTPFGTISNTEAGVWRAAM